MTEIKQKNAAHDAEHRKAANKKHCIKIVAQNSQKIKEAKTNENKHT